MIFPFFCEVSLEVGCCLTSSLHDYKKLSTLIEVSISTNPRNEVKRLVSPYPPNFPRSVDDDK